MRLLVVVPCSWWFSVCICCAQYHAGAAIGWSTSGVWQQGGPLIAVLGQRTNEQVSLRISLETQLPGTHYTRRSDDGRGKMLSVGGWSDGRQREIITSQAMSMVAIGGDHLFHLRRPARSKLGAYMGPGLAYMAEQVRTDSRVVDIATDSTSFVLQRFERRVLALRATMGASYRLPLGLLVLEASTDAYCADWGTAPATSKWFQRQHFRLAAVFPIGRE